jgi:hypothetical protein
MSADAGGRADIRFAHPAVDPLGVGTGSRLLLGGLGYDCETPGRHSVRNQLINEVFRSPTVPAGAGKCGSI